MTTTRNIELDAIRRRQASEPGCTCGWAPRSACDLHHDQPRYCETCGAWTFNDDHTCPVYDGPPCRTCGEPTLFYTVGAPGIGSGWTCRNNHADPIVAARIMEPWETV
jgi:hypothetical protein